MPRVQPNKTEAINSDSFLDIVASVVSIMIIMVVMEGVRIRNTPVNVSIPANPAAEALAKDVAAEQSLRVDVAKLMGEIGRVQRTTTSVAAERDLLATMVSAVEHKIEEHRHQLEGDKQGDFDLARKLSESKQQLEQLRQQRTAAEQDAGAPTVIESYPTPISREVDGPEAHILISNGRVVFIPLEGLLEQLQTSARRKAQELTSQEELTDMVGPVGDFRLKYTLERYDVAPDPSVRQRGGSFARLQRWTLVPTTNDFGEPVRLALADESDFQQTLRKILPGRTTITIWVYPDGFDAFRDIRKELYRRGYSIAARPLPPGEHISGSPTGSKSAAQ